jgi:hypothetical protein
LRRSEQEGTEVRHESANAVCGGDAACRAVVPRVRTERRRRGRRPHRGVGIEEREALDAQRDRYNLRLAFAEKNGSYIADVAVRLSTADGREVYSGTTDGAWLFARVQPGKYRLEADYAGGKQTRNLTVGARQAAPLIVLHWPGTSR